MHSPSEFFHALTILFCPRETSRSNAGCDRLLSFLDFPSPSVPILGVMSVNSTSFHSLFTLCVTVFRVTYCVVK